MPLDVGTGPIWLSPPAVEWQTAPVPWGQQHNYHFTSHPASTYSRYPRAVRWMQTSSQLMVLFLSAVDLLKNLALEVQMLQQAAEGKLLGHERGFSGQQQKPLDCQLWFWQPLPVGHTLKELDEDFVVVVQPHPANVAYKTATGVPWWTMQSNCRSFACAWSRAWNFCSCSVCNSRSAWCQTLTGYFSQLCLPFTNRRLTMPASVSAMPLTQWRLAWTLILQTTNQIKSL